MEFGNKIFERETKQDLDLIGKEDIYLILEIEKINI